MDPDDLPTVLKFPGLRAAQNSKEFERLFLDEICNHHYQLPLDRLCVNGGGGDDVEDEEVEVQDFGATDVTGTYSFAFTESYYGGCRDIDLRESHHGTLEFTFDRVTGDLELSGGTSQRVYDPEEF